MSRMLGICDEKQRRCIQPGMEKPAQTEHSIVDLLRRRWSPISFDQDREVPQSVLEQLFEAARWAASSYNEQPWTYILGVKKRDAAQFERLASTLVPGNAWAHNAPVLALSIAKKFFTAQHAPNRVALHDVGAANASLTLQAMAEGLFVHQMAGFDADKARELFRIPEEHDPVSMIALGYPGDPEKLDAQSKARELSGRKRKPIQEFVFTGDWGEKGL